MKNRLQKFYVIFLLLLCSWATESLAVGVDYSGYFRFRQNYYHNLNLDRDRSPNWRNFGDFRFRLNPSFYVTDEVRIHSSLNFMDGIFGGNELRAHSFGNPATRNHPSFSDPAGPVGRAIPQEEQSSWVYGGAYAPDAAAADRDLTPIQLRRAWAEVDLPFGILKAGRMPFHFGLGIFGNSGDGVDQEIGSTRDRVVFETTFGSYFIRPGFGWFFEGLLDSGNDDAHEFFLELGQETELRSLGLYLANLSQSSGSANSGAFAGEKTNYWVIDLYGRRSFEQLTAEAEVALFTGTFAGKKLFAVNAVTRASWERARFASSFELGLSTGTSDSDANQNKLRSFAFNRDYNIALLVFNEALPGGDRLAGEADNEVRASAPHSGAISNTLYSKLKFKYEMASYFHPELHLIAPFALEQSNQAGGKFYGFEYNIVTNWPITRHVTGNISLAHFIPSSFYKNVSRSQSAILARAGFNVVF